MSEVTIDTLAKAGGSLRNFLAKQGVTDEEVLRAHMQFILDTESATGRRLDLNRYRVDDRNPNQFPPMMG